MASPFVMPRTEKEWSKFRNQVQKLINRANSQLEKLERENLENTPSYKTFTTSEGRSRFGIKGLKNEYVNAEFQKVKAFLDNETSTVKGAKKYIRSMSKIMGMTYGQTQAQLPNFWAIADELRKSLQAANMSYLALDSERVVDTIRGVIEEQNEGISKIENMEDALQSALEQLEENLPNAFQKDTKEYLSEYIESLDLKGMLLDLR